MPREEPWTSSVAQLETNALYSDIEYDDPADADASSLRLRPVPHLTGTIHNAGEEVYVAARTNDHA